MPPLWPYLAYLRPRSFVPTGLFVVTGYALSPHKPDTALGQALDVLWLLAVYSVLLWGGANALNSAEDRDTGPVNLMPAPPPRPPGLGLFGLFVSALAVPLAATRGWRPAVVVAIGFLLSVFYSVRPPSPLRRGKEIPGVDMLINTLGCGLAAVVLGYVATPAPLTAEVFLVGLAFTVCIWGGIPTSQIFQLSSSSDQADRNYTACLGASAVLRLAPLFFLAHLGLLVFHAAWWRPELFAHWLALPLWLTWAALVGAAAWHSWRWSAAPFDRAY